MMLSRGKKNRRRKTTSAFSKPGRTLLRNLPRPRLPRGRTAAVLVAVLVLAALAAWPLSRAYQRGTFLTVARIEVVGNRHWQTTRLLERAGLEIGQRGHEIPFRAARKALTALPGIEGATVRYLPGGRLRVHVQEAQVVAVRRTPAGWRGLTPTGSWMPLAAHIPEDVPVLEGKGLSQRTTQRTGAWLASVRTRHPEVFAGFSQVSPRGQTGEADVYWRDGRVRLRVDCGISGDESLGYLAELMRREQAGWAEGATVDLRVEGYAYVL
jgi:hypothetical protein